MVHNNVYSILPTTVFHKFEHLGMKIIPAQLNSHLQTAAAGTVA